jgi:hypothetical protein
MYMKFQNIITDVVYPCYGSRFNNTVVADYIFAYDVQFYCTFCQISKWQYSLRSFCSSSREQLVNYIFI